MTVNYPVEAHRDLASLQEYFQKFSASSEGLEQAEYLANLEKLLEILSSIHEYRIESLEVNKQLQEHGAKINENNRRAEFFRNNLKEANKLGAERIFDNVLQGSYDSLNKIVADFKDPLETDEALSSYFEGIKILTRSFEQNLSSLGFTPKAVEVVTEEVAPEANAESAEAQATENTEAQAAEQQGEASGK